MAVRLNDERLLANMFVAVTARPAKHITANIQMDCPMSAPRHSLPSEEQHGSFLVFHGVPPTPFDTHKDPGPPQCYFSTVSTCYLAPGGWGSFVPIPTGHQ